MLAWSCDGTTLLPLRKSPSTLNLQNSRLLKQYDCVVLDIELTEKNTNKELGLFIDSSLQGLSFCPPKTFKPNKQTSWNTKHLHGIAWSSGKPDYDKLFAIFYDIKVIIKVMNAEVFAKGVEKCRLLSSLLGQNIENLNDYCCLKIKDLVKTDSSWICSRYLFRHKTSVHCAERKTMVYGEWVIQHL